MGRESGDILSKGMGGDELGTGSKSFYSWSPFQKRDSCYGFHERRTSFSPSSICFYFLYEFFMLVVDLQSLNDKSLENGSVENGHNYRCIIMTQVLHTC